MPKRKTIYKILLTIFYLSINGDILFHIGDIRPEYTIDYPLLTVGIIFIFFACVGIYSILTYFDDFIG